MPGHGDDDDDEDNEDEDGDGQDPGDADTSPSVGPRLISKEEFHEEDPPYAKISATYYLGDTVLADDRNNPIRTPDIIVGKDFASYFGKDPSDPHVIHIRNDKMMVDFEIATDERSWVEAMGYGRPV